MFHVLCLQGGGVLVVGGTVAISSCTISGNTPGNVHAHFRMFTLPPWENCGRACPRLTLYTTANAFVNYRGCVLQRP